MPPAISAAGQGGSPQRRIKSFAPALARRLAVRQQVDQDHCRNLRMASPQEVRYDGASRRIFFSRTPSPISMPSNGLASAAGKRRLQRHGLGQARQAAEPPASMM